MRRFLIITILGLILGAAALPVAAHPLGNFTTNVHLGVSVEERDLSVTLVVDMAEIPTFREPLDSNGDGVVNETELADHALSTCRTQSDRIQMVVGDDPIVLDLQRSFGELRPGEGELRTLRVECAYIGSLPPAADRLSVSNQAFADRTGWAEIVVTGGTADGVTATSPSAVLTDYPDSAPLSQREADIRLGTSSGGAPPPKADAPAITARLAEGLASTGSTGTLVALAAALGLGATHALAPGHGKTLMAAYLVGRRGRPRQAIGLGLAVAISHTVGVAVLGLVTALASSAFQPETVYPWLTTGSALIVTGLGIALLVKAMRRPELHHHEHGHHEHGHHQAPPSDLGWRSLATLGLAGGLVPSASAVVLLLGAVAIGKPWFGVALVFAFGVGMSVALVAAGLVALRITSAGMDRLRRRVDLPARLVPTAAGLVVTAVGVFLVWDGARTLI